MKRPELLAAFRQDADDEANAHLWSDAELLRFLNDAQREACERAHLLRDASTAAVCQVAVVAGTAVYPLSALILRVERAQLRLDALPLSVSSTPEMDARAGNWQSWRGRPRWLVVDSDAGSSTGLSGRLCPTPTEADTLDLVVSRLPLAPMNTDDDAPEIGARLHLGLVQWMLHLAYLKRDVETFNETKAALHETIFSQLFGERIDANAQRKQAERRTHTVQFREFG